MTIDTDGLSETDFREMAAKLDAARAMLAALKESLPFVCSVEEPAQRLERRTRVEQWRKLRDIIAQAEAAGIKA